MQRSWVLRTVRVVKMRQHLAVAGIGVVAGSVAIIGCSGSAGNASPGQQQTVLVTCLGKAEVKPANFVTSCANADVRWRNVTWTSWGTNRAVGEGQMITNICTPACDSGRFVIRDGKLVLKQPQRTRRFGTMFTAVTFPYAPSGVRRPTQYGIIGRLNPHTTTLRGSTEFLYPNSGISCELDYHRPGVPNLDYCQNFSPSESVHMTTSGMAKICKGDTCVGNPGDPTPTLKYGKIAKAGPFVCHSSHADVVCAVPNGKGFLINKRLITPIRGY